jgi:hypothetical protein
MAGKGSRAWSIVGVGRVVLLLDLALLMAFALHLSGVAVTGAGRDQVASRTVPNPVILLGHAFDQTGCASAPQGIGDGYVVVCRDFTAITDRDGRMLVASLYGSDGPAAHRYRGVMPEGLAWGDSLAQVLAELGKPAHISRAWGPPTLVYMFDGMPYGSLELRFNGAGRLQSISACLTR